MPVYKLGMWSLLEVDNLEAGVVSKKKILLNCIMGNVASCVSEA